MNKLINWLDEFTFWFLFVVVLFLGLIPGIIVLFLQILYPEKRKFLI